MTRYPLCKFEVHDEHYLTLPKKYAGSGILFNKKPIMFFETREEAEVQCNLLNLALTAHENSCS